MSITPLFLCLFVVFSFCSLCFGHSPAASVGAHDNSLVGLLSKVLSQQSALTALAQQLEHDTLTRAQLINKTLDNIARIEKIQTELRIIRHKEQTNKKLQEQKQQEQEQEQVPSHVEAEAGVSVPDPTPTPDESPAAVEAAQHNEINNEEQQQTQQEESQESAPAVDATGEPASDGDSVASLSDSEPPALTSLPDGVADVNKQNEQTHESPVEETPGEAAEEPVVAADPAVDAPSSSSSIESEAAAAADAAPHEAHDEAPAEAAHSESEQQAHEAGASVPASDAASATPSDVPVPSAASVPPPSSSPIHTGTGVASFAEEMAQAMKEWKH